MDSKAGLVLTGGGARGAYQAGALWAIAEIVGGGSEMPFPVLAGTSAGSISAAYIASRADRFGDAARELAEMWGTITPHDVFRTDAATLTRVGLDWAADLGFGGWIGTGRGKSLLLTEPMRAFLASRLDFDAIRTHVQRGRLRGFALTATNYNSGNAVTFFEGAADIEPWVRSTRLAIRAQLSMDHVMASAAIPVFFPAVPLDGAYYADGCIRMNTPLSPAVHMGADRIVAIGIRHAPTPEEVAASNVPVLAPVYPSKADTAGVLLNALFLDALEADVERLLRINRTVQLIPQQVLAGQASALRRVPILVLRPSVDLGALVMKTIDRLPYLIRHLFRGLGASDKSGWDLLSYLAFDGEYTTRLLQLGYDDAMASRDALVAFLTEESR